MKKIVLCLLAVFLSVGVGYNYMYGGLGSLIKKAAKKAVKGVKKVAKKAVKEVEKTADKAIKGAEKTVKEIGQGDIKGAIEAGAKTVATTATTAAKGVAAVSKTGFEEFKDTFSQIGECAKVVGLGTAWAAQKGTYEATKIAFKAADEGLKATETATKGVMTAISKVTDVGGILLTKYFVLEEVSLQIDVGKMLPPKVQLPVFKLKGSVFGKDFNVIVDWDGDDISKLAKDAIRAISKVVPLDDLLKKSPIQIQLGKKKKKKKKDNQVVVVDENDPNYDPTLYYGDGDAGYVDVDAYDEYYDTDYADGSSPQEPTDPGVTTEEYWTEDSPMVYWDDQYQMYYDASGNWYDQSGNLYNPDSEYQDASDGSIPNASTPTQTSLTNNQTTSPVVTTPQTSAPTSSAPLNLNVPINSTQATGEYVKATPPPVPAKAASKKTVKIK